MAANVHIDLNGIGEQIAAAVEKAVEKATVNTQPSFGIRAQIIANAEFLWPCARSSWVAQHPESATQPNTIDATKSLSLLIQGTSSKNTIVAQITTSPIKADGCLHEFVFLEADPTDSPEKALDLLLKTTMSMIERDGEGDRGFEFAFDEAECVKDGRMEVPTGVCETCDQVIWS
ncbi:hypothetical protein LTR10_000199 [Elasticomyces elasticus]|nr:hypothetical protein LTR10_000199 [Elasticomyces elasticus]KAK4980542.1 hypothetical protein LTR42_000850 [Elasticomyces elasticus]